MARHFRAEFRCEKFYFEIFLLTHIRMTFPYVGNKKNPRLWHQYLSAGKIVQTVVNKMVFPTAFC